MVLMQGKMFLQSRHSPCFGHQFHSLVRLMMNFRCFCSSDCTLENSKFENNYIRTLYINIIDKCFFVSDIGNN